MAQRPHNAHSDEYYVPRGLFRTELVGESKQQDAAKDMDIQTHAANTSMDMEATARRHKLLAFQGPVLQRTLKPFQANRPCY